MFAFEQTVTLSFIVDVCFNFNTAFLDEDERWIVDRGLIAQRYLSGWFWIDAPSSIPVELLDMILEGDSSSLGLLKFLRLFRLLRLLRLLKLGEYVSALEIKFDLNLTFLRILTMVLNMLFLAHMLGCFWFYTAAMVGLDEDTVTWVSSYDDGSALFADASTQYLYSVYWALTTLTTVGYGDITPTNNAERLYSLGALLIGALVFGFMLSSIGALVAAVDRQAALSEERLDEVKEYMRWRKLPRDLVIRMRRHYTYYYTRNTAFDEPAILDALTPALRFEVVQHTLKDTIGRIPLFSQTLDPHFQMKVFPLLKPLSASPKEIIFSKGEQSQALFFLIKGQVEVISGVDGRVLYRVDSGSFFGEAVLTGRRRSATHRAALTCEMLLISGDDLRDLFAQYPREAKVIHSAVLKEHVRKERMRGLSLKLLINRLNGAHALEQQMIAAALKLQFAWNRVCDQNILDLVEFDEAAPSAAPPDPASAVVVPGDHLGGAGHSGGPASPSFSVGSVRQVTTRDLNKLDKLDSILEEVRALSKAVQSGGFRTGRGRLMGS